MWVNFYWNTLFFYKHQVNWVQPQLCLIWNLIFLKIYSTNQYDFMLEILFRRSLFFWYMKMLLESFSFWDNENVKPKFQPIVRKGVPASPPSFLRHPSLDPARPPLFKIFVTPPFFSVSPSFKVFSTVPPTLTQLHPALIRPTNLPWFRQISKGWFYQFNCHFLSKINF